MSVPASLCPATEKLEIVTPFQIFCYQERDNVARMNPHLKGVAITSLLGRMWRSLSDSAKVYYNTLSVQLRRHPPDHPLHFEALPATVPSIPVVARSRFGANVALVSKRLLASSKESHVM